MVNKVRLWVSRRMRELTLAISFALFVGVALFVVFELLGLNIRDRATSVILVIVLAFSGAITTICLLWNKIASFIPLTRVQQELTPDKWISAQAANYDAASLLMDGLILARSVYIDVKLVSRLPFEVRFVHLGGYAIINDTSTTNPSRVLENLSDCKLGKRGVFTKQPWRLDLKDSTAPRETLHGQFSGVVNKIKLHIEGIDDKNRHYSLETNEVDM